MLEDRKFLFEFIDDMPIGIARADSREELPNHYNKFFLDMFGWSEEEIDTLEKWFLKAYPDDAYREQLIELWGKIIQEAEDNKLSFSRTIEAEVSCKDGSVKTCEARYYRKEHFIYGIFVDVSERKAVENKLEILSCIDELTQLNNRKSYKKRITELLSVHERYKTVFTMMMFDIDDFKMINDTYGHSAGDDVLASISQLIRSHIRESDYIFRVGGEEFVILFYEMPLEKSKLVAEKIRNSVENNLSTEKGIKNTISIGISEVRAGDTKDGIYKRVDALMYESKHRGKNKITFD